MTANELKALRKSTNLPQEKFAVLVLGVSGGTLGRWERGNCKIPALSADGVALRVAAYLKKAAGSGESDLT